MFKKLGLIALAALAVSGALISPGVARASTATGTIAVSAVVTNACSIAATPMAFGTYAFGATSTANSTITVTCTIGTVVASVLLGDGLQPSTATPPVRQLKAPGLTPTIPYNVFSDAGLTTTWRGLAFPAASAFTALVTPTLLTAYGQAPNGANVALGSYSDSIVATVNYT